MERDRQRNRKCTGRGTGSGSGSGTGSGQEESIDHFIAVIIRSDVALIYRVNR